MISILKLAVLSSTRATDMDALVDAIRYDSLKAQIVVVIANKKCPALERAVGFGIPAVFLDGAGKSREEYDRELHKVLRQHQVDLVLLIGYMRYLSKWFVNQWPHKIMNIHPSLLPEFAGGMDLNVHEEVLKAGKKESGATLHFVDETADGGPIIFQKKVKIDDDETAETLKHKVQSVEQELIVKAVRLYADKKINVRDNTVLVEE